MQRDERGLMLNASVQHIVVQTARRDQRPVGPFARDRPLAGHDVGRAERRHDGDANLRRGFEEVGIGLEQRDAVEPAASHEIAGVKVAHAHVLLRAIARL